MKQYLILIILLSWLAACGRLERKPEPTPTLAPTPTAALTDKLMGPLLPPTVTLTLTGSKKPSATPSLTTEPIATRTPRVYPSRTPTALPEVSFSQDGERLQDGWIGYRVPDSQIMIELPDSFVVIQMNESSLDEVMGQIEALFPEIAKEIDLRRLFEQNIRLLALDLQEVGQTEGQFASTRSVTLSVVPVGDTPLEALLLLNSAEMRKLGALNLSEPQSVSYLSYGRGQASMIDYELPIGETTVHGRQLYLLADQTLHIMTATHLPNGDDSALVDHIISRITFPE